MRLDREQLRRNPALGPVLANLRRRVGLTQREAAKAVSKLRGDGSEMSVEWYAKLENRANSYPSTTDLGHLLQVLGTSEAELAALVAGESDGGDESEELSLLAEPQALDAPAPFETWSSQVTASPPPPPAAKTRGLFDSSPRIRSRRAGASALFAAGSLSNRLADESSPDLDALPARPDPPSWDDLRSDYEQLSGADRSRVAALIRSARARSK